MNQGLSELMLHFRFKVSELERVAVKLIKEIDEFPRYWKHTVLFHGVPTAAMSSGHESIYILGHAVCDIITKTLGVRDEIVITEISRLAPSLTDHGGCPALAVTFRHGDNKMTVLKRAGTMKHGRSVTNHKSVLLLHY